MLCQLIQFLFIFQVASTHFAFPPIWSGSSQGQQNGSNGQAYRRNEPWNGRRSQWVGILFNKAIFFFPTMLTINLRVLFVIRYFFSILVTINSAVNIKVHSIFLWNVHFNCQKISKGNCRVSNSPKKRTNFHP